VSLEKVADPDASLSEDERRATGTGTGREPCQVKVCANALDRGANRGGWAGKIPCRPEKGKKGEQEHRID